MVQVFLETRRLVLRRFTVADADDLESLDADPEVMRLSRAGWPRPAPRSRTRSCPPSSAITSDTKASGLAAAEKATGEFLGWFHFRPRPDAVPGEAELGYRLRRSAWGKGYATEGSRALICKGFTEFGVQRVVAETMAVTRASQRVMEKSGLKLVRAFHQPWPYPIEGDQFGDVEYALDKAGWQHDQAGVSGCPPP
jgi:RimJ/RimL family protein N-acetyltransferase